MGRFSEYPEHEKVKLVQSSSETIGGFLEWLQEHCYTICEGQQRYGEMAYIPVNQRIDVWLAAYFEVDLVKLDAEKRAMLEEFRAATQPAVSQGSC